MIDEGLWQLLTAAPSITTLCGTRIYPVILPDDAKFPALTYQTIVAPQAPTFETSGQQHWRMQFDCWGKTFADAAALRAALIRTLNGAQQALTDGTILQNAHLHSVMDDFASASRTYRCIADVTLDFNFQF